MSLVCLTIAGVKIDLVVSKSLVEVHAKKYRRGSARWRPT